MPPPASLLAGAVIGLVAAPAITMELFNEAWKKVVLLINPSKIPLCFRKSSSFLPKPTLIFCFSSSIETSHLEVDSFVVSTTGQMGILLGHTATMTELNCVGGGCVFNHPNLVVDTVTVEVVPIVRFNPDVVKRVLPNSHRSQAQLVLVVFDSTMPFSLLLQVNAEKLV